MKNILLNILVAALVNIVISSCANTGVPMGGPKDEEGPVVENTNPENFSLNFKDDKISIYFDEFVQLKEMTQKFMMSPPQKKKPSIKLRGKYIQIELRDSLRKNTTYTMDFADAIVDNNEGNPLSNFQYAFSTGESFDTLMIQGDLKDAFTLQPIENAFVMIYEDHNDSVPLVQVPSYIARTDTSGHFSINNIRQRSYRIMAITDNNRDYIFNSPVEPVAYFDSLVTPEAIYEEKMDTLTPDSVMQVGYTLFAPADIELFMFQEKDPQLYLTKYDRPRRERLEFHFNRERSDSLKIDLLNMEEGKEWFFLEKSRKNDTLNYWITDSLIFKQDTLMAELQYLKSDTLGRLVTIRDTVKLNYKTPKKGKLSKKKAKKIKDIKPMLEYKADIPASLDLNKNLILEFNEPLTDMELDSIHLLMIQDTLEVEQEFQIVQDSILERRYHIVHKWKPETQYKLQIDSAAFRNIYGLTTKELIKKFKTREMQYYGKIILNISNVNTPLIVQLLKDNKNRPVVQSQRIKSDQQVIFSYLHPESYIIKVIKDRNDNGEWDTGNYLQHLQPENVHFFKIPIKVRSNWDVEESWIIP